MPENAKVDFYHRERRFNSALSKLDSWCKTETNKKLIFRLLGWAHAMDISYARRTKYLFFLKYTVEWLNKDLDTVEKGDIISLMGKINDTSFTSETKREFKHALRKFYDVVLYDERKDLLEWMYDRRNDIFKTKNTGLRNEKTKLTKKEIALLIHYADIRMKAYISTLFESCCRPSELLACKIKDLKPTEYGFMLNLPQSKTEIRSIPLVESSQFLRDWLSKHPKNEPETFLFCTNAMNKKGSLWSVEATSHEIQKIVKLAGIDKKATNYTLRRSGFTYKSCVKKISNSSMELLMGWSKGAFSRRAKDYDLNTEEDAHNEIMLAYGKLKNKEVIDLGSKRCIRCNEENGFANEYCSKCSTPLDSNIVMNIHMKQILYEKLLGRLVESIDVDKLAVDKFGVQTEVQQLLSALKG